MLHSKVSRLGNNDKDDQHGVFQGCASLLGGIVWDLPNLATNVVAEGIFKNCVALTRVDFGINVVEIRASAFSGIAGGAEVHMPAKAPAFFGSDAVCRSTAPYTKLYRRDNVEDWIAVIRNTHHVILRDEFNDTAWTDTYGNDTKRWSDITAKMAQDTAMCTKTTVDKVTTVTVPNRNVIAFAMRGNNTGCWILREAGRPTIFMLH